MKRYLPLALLTLLAACGAQVHVSGDAAAIGAKVLVDGREAAVLEERVYEGGAAGPAGQKYAAARFRVDAGTRRFEVVPADGRRLYKTLEVRGEAYLTVDVSKGELR